MLLQPSHATLAMMMVMAMGVLAAATAQDRRQVKWPRGSTHACGTLRTPGWQKVGRRLAEAWKGVESHGLRRFPFSRAGLLPSCCLLYIGAGATNGRRLDETDHCFPASASDHMGVLECGRESRCLLIAGLNTNTLTPASSLFALCVGVSLCLSQCAALTSKTLATIGMSKTARLRATTR